MICRHFALVLALCLAGCGGGGDDPQPSCVKAGTAKPFTYPGPTPPDAVLPVASSPINFSLDLFGDSTNWLAYAYWREAFGPNVVLHAQRGTTSTDLLNGTDGINLPWPHSVASQVVVVNHGMNDAAQPLSLAAYKANLRRFALAPAVIVFETPNPSTQVDTAPYAQAMREVATEVGAKVIDVQACMLARPDWQTLLYDGVHPTDEGRKFIVEACVTPVVKTLGCQS